MKPLLRVSTAGSVDDGKSSLIGRLLYDSKSIFEDQLQAIERASSRRGSDAVELALLTDGLRAEREQNITIDVAYRYFATPHRKFIIADTPGHEQYTRNMVTGTSTSDISIILIDARKGVLTQSKRHAAISSLLGVKVLIVAVNKMDLVAFSQERFEEIRQDFIAKTSGFDFEKIHVLPISALLGDNVVEKGTRLDWYEGPTLLHLLETLDVPSRNKLDALRLPIQYVIRPDQDFRGLAGQIEAGSVHEGDLVRLLPSNRTARIRGIFSPSGDTASGSVGEPVVVTLDEHVDLSRGDMIASDQEPPIHSNLIDAVVCWMHSIPAVVGKRYMVLHANRHVSAHIVEITSRLSMETLQEEPAERLHLNDIGRIVFETSSPLNFDPYDKCNATGSVLFVDPGTSVTIGAGMLKGSASIGRESTSVGEAVAFLINGGTDHNRTALAELLASRLRSTGVPVLSAQAGEFNVDGSESDSLSLDGLVSVFARNGIALILASENSGEAQSLAVGRYRNGGWEFPSLPAENQTTERLVQEILQEEWSPEI